MPFRQPELNQIFRRNSTYTTPVPPSFGRAEQKASTSSFFRQAPKLTRRFVEFVEQIQALLDRPPCRARTKACFGIELDEGNSGQFFHELVHADLAPLGQQAQPLLFIV